MFKTHYKKEIVNLYRVNPNETISTAKLGSLSNYDDDQNDDFKKTNRFNDQNNSSASRFLVHFFDVHCTTTT